MAVKISSEGKIGIGLSLLGLFGAGVVIVLPDFHPFGWLLIGGSLVGALVLALHHCMELWRDRHAPGGVRKLKGFIVLTAVAVGLFSFGAWHFWPKPGIAATSVVAPKKATAPALPASDGRVRAPPVPPQPTPSLDNTIRLNCQWGPFPTTAPSGGLYLMYIGQKGMTLAAPTAPLQPTGKVRWPTEYPDYVQLCEIKNYGTSPIPRIQTIFSFNFRENLKTENGSRSGQTISSVRIPAPFQPIEIEAAGTADIVFINTSDLWAEGVVPPTAFVQSVGSDRFRSTKLVPPESSNFVLSPKTTAESAKN